MEKEKKQYIMLLLQLHSRLSNEVVRLADANNNIVVVSLKKEEQQQEVGIPATDTLKSPWKYDGQGLPRVDIA